LFGVGLAEEELAGDAVEDVIEGVAIGEEE
jgi:hypothetical protein